MKTDGGIDDEAFSATDAEVGMHEVDGERSGGLGRWG